MKILYVAGGPFPDGSAYSTRLKGFCHAIRELGWNCHVISDYSNSHRSGAIYEFESGTFESLAGASNRINRAKCYLSGVRRVGQYLDSNKVDIVIGGNPYDRFNRLRRVCDDHHVPLVLEICEWYDTSTWKLGVLNPFVWIYKRCMKKWYPQADGVIAISRLLMSHFRSLEIETIRIPSILDVRNFPNRVLADSGRSVIRLVHVGFSGLYKEKYGPVLEGLRGLTESERARFEYHIYGASPETVRANLGSGDGLISDGVSVTIHGRIDHSEVPYILRDADYSIFFRPVKRSNKAGFPTKLAESMAAGTPVITNDVGDVSLYLNDGENGFILREAASGEVRSLLRRLLTLTDARKADLRAGARQTALNAFDFRCHTTALGRFLEDLASENDVL